FNYYEGTNFIPTFDYSKIRIKRQQTTDNGQQTATISVFDNESESETFYQVYDYFNTKMRSRNCCIQHDEYDFSVITEDLELFDNHLLVAKYGEDICGLAFCYLRNGEIFIKDVFAESSAIFSDLITAAANTFDNETINIFLPPVPGQKTHKLGMARIIDAETMLRIYAMTHPKMKIEISIVDPILTHNNGTYYINNGVLDKKNSIGANVVDIEQLTQALFGYNIENLPEKLQAFNKQAAFMSLMLD
ncbi:MAG: sterol carrier protein domain-containing protein, partial [Bacteroidales bacterium]|nr:sterol carrier protein domain-containing protein [Bacteroidales bacterium]